MEQDWADREAERLLAPLLGPKKEELVAALKEAFARGQLSGCAGAAVKALDDVYQMAGQIVPDACCDRQGQHYGIASVREIISGEMAHYLAELQESDLPLEV